jgi:hypothetical protein
MCGHTCTTNGSGCEQATCISGTCGTVTEPTGTKCGDAGGTCSVAGLCL